MTDNAVTTSIIIRSDVLRNSFSVDILLLLIEQVAFSFNERSSFPVYFPAFSFVSQKKKKKRRQCMNVDQQSTFNFTCPCVDLPFFSNHLFILMSAPSQDIDLAWGIDFIAPPPPHEGSDSNDA